MNSYVAWRAPRGSLGPSNSWDQKYGFRQGDGRYHHKAKWCMDKLVEWTNSWKETFPAVHPAKEVTYSKQRVPPMTSPSPKGSWLQASADFCGPVLSSELNLLVLNAYSKYPVVENISKCCGKGQYPSTGTYFCHRRNTRGLKNRQWTALLRRKVLHTKNLHLCGQTPMDSWETLGMLQELPIARGRTGGESCMSSSPPHPSYYKEPLWVMHEENYENQTSHYHESVNK